MIHSNNESAKKPLVLATLCHKGGVGKTFTTIALADAITLKYPDAKVLIVDCDEQSNLKTVFGVKLRDTEGGLSSILLENVNPEHVAIKVRPQIDLILSGGRAMREFEKRYGKEDSADFLLQRRFSKISSYDVILMDSPPALSLISTNIVTFADYVLLPCSPDLLSVVGVKGTIDFIDTIRRSFEESEFDVKVSKVLGVIPNQIDSRRNLDLDIVEDLERLESSGLLEGGVVFESVPIDIKVKTAQIKRKLLSEIFPDKSRALASIKIIVDQIEQKLQMTFLGDPVRNNISKPKEVSTHTSQSYTNG